MQFDLVSLLDVVLQFVTHGRKELCEIETSFDFSESYQIGMGSSTFTFESG